MKLMPLMSQENMGPKTKKGRLKKRMNEKQNARPLASFPPTTPSTSGQTTMPYPSEQMYPISQLYPSGQIPSGQMGYPVGMPYPSTQAFPTGMPYPSSQAFPGGPLYPGGQFPGSVPTMPSGSMIPGLPQPTLPTPPGQLPIEESYVENILRLNLGRVATIYATYENNTQWNAKVFKGELEAAGRDHIIISDRQTGMRTLLLMVNVDYVTFDQPLKYTYPF